MSQHKVIDLINQFMEDHGQSSGKDRVMLWFEDVYSKVRRMPWSWNFVTTETQTGGDHVATPVITSVITYDAAGAVVLASTETFSWTQGDAFITSTLATVAAVDGNHTGRYVYIDNEWYMCVRIAPTGFTNTIFLDKKIVAASQAVDPDTGLAKQMSFYRRDLAFRTNGIKSLHVDDKKLGHLTEEQIYRFKRGIDPRWYYGDAGTPLAYHLDEFVIAPPKFAPTATLAVDLSSSNTLGTHRAFWTFVDRETGQESPPGPSIDYTLTSALPKVTVGYGSSSGHSDDESTYYRKLYVTKKIETYTRNPSYEAAEQSSGTVSAVSFSISDSDIDNTNGYYDGPWTRTVMYPAPDEYLRAEVLHIDSYFGLPGEDDIVKLGRQREFIELLQL